MSQQSTHWYTREGKLLHQIECKTIPNKFRVPDIRDARKMPLFPSVNGIIDMKAKPGLEKWKRDQLFETFMENPIQSHESKAEYSRRISKIYQEKLSKAAILGTKIHRAIEQYHSRGDYDTEDKQVEIALGTYIEWEMNCNEMLGPIDREVSFVCKEGYGGTVDAMDYVYPAVYDYKSQATKKGEKIKTYPEVGYQLVAYANGVAMHDAKLKEIVISTTEPGRIEVVDWTDQKDKLLEAFRACFTLWKLVKNYDPTGEK